MASTKHSGEVTQLLESWRTGDTQAPEELLPLVYDELRKLAASYMRKEHRRSHTLQPTALVHEAWLRLVGSDPLDAEDRSHFFVIAARAMRRVLVDHARRHQAQKRIDPKDQVPLEGAMALTLAAAPNVDILSLHSALSRLSEAKPRLGQLVELRFFGGLTNAESADVLGVSEATVERDWQVARLWLHRRLAPS